MDVDNHLKEFYIPGALDSDEELPHSDAEWRRLFVPGGLDSDAELADDEDDPDNDQYTPRRPSRKSHVEPRRNSRSRLDSERLWGGEEELVICRPMHSAAFLM